MVGFLVSVDTIGSVRPYFYRLDLKNISNENLIYDHMNVIFQRVKSNPSGSFFIEYNIPSSVDKLLSSCVDTFYDITNQSVSSIVANSLMYTALKSLQLGMRSASLLKEKVMGKDQDQIVQGQHKIAFDAQIKKSLHETLVMTNAIYSLKKHSAGVIYGKPTEALKVFSELLARNLFPDGQSYLRLTYLPGRKIFQSKQEGFAFVNDLFKMRWRDNLGLVVFIENADILFSDLNKLDEDGNSRSYEILHYLFKRLGEKGGENLVVICSTEHPELFEEAMKQYTATADVPLFDEATRCDLFAMYFQEVAKSMKHLKNKFEAQLKKYKATQYLEFARSAAHLTKLEIESIVRDVANAFVLTSIYEQKIIDVAKTTRKAIHEYAQRVGADDACA